MKSPQKEKEELRAANNIETPTKWRYQSCQKYRRAPGGSPYLGRRHCRMVAGQTLALTNKHDYAPNL